MGRDVNTELRAAYHIAITGVVQGVGFRPFVYNLAERLGVRGWVLNHSGGIAIEAEGAPDVLTAFIAVLEAEAPPLAYITSLTAVPILPNGYDSFEIRHSQQVAGQYQLLSPDVAMCDDCLRELFDPADRRYRYPFINCTNCGPRFTIILDIPYDRPKTTMCAFSLCADCRAEYENPADRRFHAQPNACPVCGPHVWLSEKASGRESESARKRVGEKASQREGEMAREQAAHHAIYNTQYTNEASLLRAKELLESGAILAIKGLGGFHLAGDATNADAVRVLRERKRRPHKPFAVMLPTLDAVRAVCEVSSEEAALLTSPQSPIVLLKCLRNTQYAIVNTVAPNQHTLGVMLPYTPLHHILLRDVGRPLVMTSGNVTEEPIARDNAEALRRLAPLADAFLLHNRDIYARYDDSVVQVLPFSEAPSHSTFYTSENEKRESVAQLVRRARGYAPLPIRLPFATRPMLAVGPLLKNTFTLTQDQFAFVSQHIGDMENLETLAHYEAALATYRRLFRITPEWVVADMHPDYLTTRFAQEYASEHCLPAPLQVQHHEAHIAACLADNGRALEAGPVIGVALDGTGYGRDGAIWGGEWFVGSYDGFRRAAQLEYLPLPGGDAAIRHPWRIAVAYLHALGDPGDYPRGFYPQESVLIRQQIEHGLNVSRTSSMGRLFDAVSALLGVCQTTTYEAQAAIELEQVAVESRGALSPYPFDLAEGEDGVLVVQLAPLFGALLAEIGRGVAVSEIAWRFHRTVAEMIAQVCERIRVATGLNTVALSGGVFQNQLLLELALPRLTSQGFEILLHRQVPTNDGGISLGQAALAQILLDRER
ncbi:MAG: carbamoyltransferase HypF [Anaerolineae bacterium]|nr:carbamoyltransferase HypF [Anaerolineae bacterium]